MEIHTVYSNITISDILVDSQSQWYVSNNFSSSLLFEWIIINFVPVTH